MLFQDFSEVSFQKSILISIGFCWAFFVWNSPIGTFFKRPLESLLNNYKAELSHDLLPDRFLRWCIDKFVYLINCIFCLTSWILLIILVVVGQDLIYFFICPWLSLLMWQFHLSLKQKNGTESNKRRAKKLLDRDY